MKEKAHAKRILTAAIITAVILCSVACSKKDEQAAPETPEANIQSDAYEEKIAYCMQRISELEAELQKKNEEIYVSDTQHKTDVAALEQTIASLKSQLESLSESNSSTQAPSNQTPGNQTSGNQNTPDTPTGNNQNAQTQPHRTEQFTYIKENNGITITKYTGNETEVKIPDTIDGTPVLKIGESAFASSRVKSVVIPEGVKTIDWFAFQTCTQLIEITIPASVTKIEYGAFEYAKSAFVIKCPKGSFVEAYAKSWGYICVAE